MDLTYCKFKFVNNELSTGKLKRGCLYFLFFHFKIYCI